MSPRGWAGSFRARFLLVVFAVTALPLGLVGFWLTGAAVRAGEGLIREHVETAVSDAAEVAGGRWLSHRSGLLDLAESEALRRALDDARTDAGPSESSADQVGSTFARRTPPDEVTAVFRSARVPLGRVQVLDAGGRPVWEYGDASGGTPGPALAVNVDVFASPLGPRLGHLRSELAVATLVPDNTPAPGGVGTLLGVYEADTGTPLSPLPFALENASEGEVSWAEDRWLTARRELVEPPLVLVAAAPLSPYSAPYLGAARRGAAVLAIVGALGLALTLLLTNRMATSLERLAEAADAVSGGDLDRSIDVRGDDEVSRVGRAFNHMTESLKTSLRDLADARALAAVGEFAAQLAHEVRNPLSAVRIDLQMVEEGLPEGSRLREIQARVISEVERLDSTVSGALRTARSGRVSGGSVDLRQPLRAAATTAGTGAGARQVDVVFESHRPVFVEGDAAALEQIFLNLLLNAVQASPEGGRVELTLEPRGGEVVIEVADRGEGIAPEDMEHVFDPLYTTRPGGSGLGLTIARRMVTALGGALELRGRTDEGGGTVARVVLPGREDVARAEASHRNAT